MPHYHQSLVTFGVASFDDVARLTFPRRPLFPVALFRGVAPFGGLATVRAHAPPNIQMQS